MGRRRKNQAEDPVNEDDEVYNPNVQLPGESTTRRSARQQQRKAAGVTFVKQDEDFEYLPLPGLGVPSSQAPKNRRFLNTAPARGGRGRNVEHESTASVLSRLIQKKGAVPNKGVAARLKHNKAAMQRKISSQPQPGSSRAVMQQQDHGIGRQTMPGLTRHIADKGKKMKRDAVADPDWVLSESMPLKVEINEGGGNIVQNPAFNTPKKRGRKRKEELEDIPQGYQGVSIKSEFALGEQAHSAPNQQKKKRGRQSTATENVKPRFPFCSICLSKTPPTDYIINHMSCPSEYQRMKRLFFYIYKDLKFPFVPFDLERDNVFDYCDLPLCDACILLYREIYNTYAQIEAAKDHVKAKVEQMVHQIQVAEQNPAVASQLNLVKTSPEPLMNKYCNFRKRFSNYKTGDTRGESDGTGLIPATIARVRVINQTPKRTTASQTFLTAGHFPATSSASQEQPQGASAKPPGSSTATAISVPLPLKSPVKIEAGRNQSQLTESGSKSKPDASSGPADNAELATAKINGGTSGSNSSVSPPKEGSSLASTSTLKPPRVPVASVLTIIKTPGGHGPAIIRKLPVSPAAGSINGQQAKSSPSAMTVEKAATIASQKKDKDSVPEPEMPPKVKDEPVEVANESEEEPDPFLNTDPSSDSSKLAKKTEGSQKNDDGQNEASASSSASEDTSDTNVFRKHKKLGVAPPAADSKNGSLLPDSPKQSMDDDCTDS